MPIDIDILETPVWSPYAELTNFRINTNELKKKKDKWNMNELKLNEAIQTWDRMVTFHFSF